MMTLSDLLKNTLYAVVFGLMGLIVGIWTADLLYKLYLKNIERVTTTYVSLIIIVLFIVFASILGFTKGKKLLEDGKENTVQATVTGFTTGKKPLE